MLKVTGAIVLAALTACSGSSAGSSPRYCPDVKDAQTWLATIDRGRADTTAEPSGEAIAYDNVRQDFDRIGFAAPRALKLTAHGGSQAASTAAIKVRGRASDAGERRTINTKLDVFAAHC